MWMGPATLVALPMVMFAVLFDLPSVKPDTPDASVRSVVVKALLKLLPEGCTVKVPVVSTIVAASTLTTSPVRVMLLLLVVTSVAAFLPMVPPVTKRKPLVPPSAVIDPVVAKMFAF